MANFTCKNKRCKHNFYSSEDKKVILCPVCGKNVYNMKLIITGKNWMYIENVIRNIETYGEKTVFNMIDKCYPNPLSRIRIREIHYQTIKSLKE